MPLTRSKDLLDLERTKAELKKLMDYSLDIICTIDKKGKFLNVSAAALKIWGYLPDELIGKPYMNYVYAADYDLTRKAAVEIMRGAGKTNFENRYIHKNSSAVPIIWSASWDNEEKIMRCIARDATERDLSLTQLKESQSKLRTATKIAKLGYWQLQLDGSGMYWSDEVYEIWGLSKNTFEVNFKSFLDTIHPEDKEKFNQEQIAFYTGQKKFELEYRIILPDNSIKWVYGLGNVLKDELNNNDIYQGTVQDITHQKNLSLQLEESNDRFKYATKATFDAIWDWNLVTNDLYFGEGFEVLFGHKIKSNDLNISIWYDHIHPDDKERVLKSIYTIVDNNSTNNWIQEYKYLKADGDIAYVIDRGFVIRNEDGKGYRMVGAMQDVTKQKEEELSLKLLESVITNTKDSIMVSEAEATGESGSQIVYVNDAFTKMTGYSSDEVIGNTSRILQGDKSDPVELKKLNEALWSGQSYEVTTINYKKSGEEFWINFSVSPVVNKEGKITHFVSIQRDITTRKKEEAQLKLFAADLYKRNQELQQFGYVVSHNLRSPVANIMGITSLLEMDKDDPETVEKCAGDLKTSVSRLDSVIRDLSKILSATDGSVALNKESINLTDLLIDIKADLKEAIIYSGAHIELPEATHILFTHKAYIYSIFYNLVSNAIKYRSERPPDIKIAINTNTQFTIITVSDNGIGIDLDKHTDDLFKPYKRFNLQVEGKGLGLFLVKSHVETLNGKIMIESKVGRGTIFTIIFSLNEDSIDKREEQDLNTLDSNQLLE
ncbi:MAG: hypothetical protein JWP44_3930 [Mucilaginibacter sp.]|nr:hypothetical protein [Mucilaginibacter sp.]